MPCQCLAANFKRSVGDVNAVEQPYKYNTLATTTPTHAATAATPGVAYSNNNNNNTLPNSKTNGFAATATATGVLPVAAQYTDKSGGQPVPAPRRTNSVPMGEAGDGGAPYNGAASTSGGSGSGDSASDAQVRDRERDGDGGNE